jgi:hypothetical protein
LPRAACLIPAAARGFAPITLRRLNLLHCLPLSAARPPVRDLDAARPERGASVAEGRDAGGGSPGLAGRERSEQPKSGDTRVAGEALAP